MHSPDPLLMAAAGRDDGGTGPGARRRARLAASRLYVCTDLQRFLRPDGTLDTAAFADFCACLLYTSPSPRDATLSRMPSSA